MVVIKQKKVRRDEEGRYIPKAFTVNSYTPEYSKKLDKSATMQFLVADYRGYRSTDPEPRMKIVSHGKYKKEIKRKTDKEVHKNHFGYRSENYDKLGRFKR